MATELSEQAGVSVPPAAGLALWWREASGSVADLGVLVPFTVALIVVNGLSATAVLLPAGIAYLIVARVYRLPVAVQPLKAFGAVAIAAGAGADVIAAGALIMGATFILLGATGWLNAAARLFAKPIIRGIQLAVALLFLKIAWGLIAAPPAAFTHQLPVGWAGVVSLALFGLLLVLRRHVILLLVGGGLMVAIWMAGIGVGDLGPSPISLPAFSVDSFATAAVLLVVPQLPLTFANSCLAPADAAKKYFPDAADRVTASRLAQTLGWPNLLAGAIAGMPVCHGAGGMSAHVAYGSRTWRTPAVIGTVLLAVALGVGAGLAAVLTSYPLPILAALLATAAVAHVRLLSDLRGHWDWIIAIAVGVIGVAVNLALALVAGMLAYALISRFRRDRPTRSAGE